MYKATQVDKSRIPTTDNYTNKELLGKFVRVVSDASHKHFKDYGRITGFTNHGEMIKVYFDETKTQTKFYRGSLELVN